MNKLPPMVKDITGQKFGWLTAIEFSHSGNGKGAHWKFRCACGKEVVKSAHLVKTRAKSCGCKAKSRYLDNRVAQKRAYQHVLGRSERKQYRYDDAPQISLEEFIELAEQNCHYCNSKPSNCAQTANGEREFVYNGLDRVDSSVGYTVDNCVPCCYRCNTAKSDMTVAEFREWIDRVSSHMAAVEARGL